MVTTQEKGINWLKAFPILYFLASLLLSITIFYRFFMPSNQVIQLGDYFLYLTFFNVVPTICAIYLFVKISIAKFSIKWQLVAIILLAVSLTSLVIGFMGISFPYEYLYIWIPVPVAYLLLAKSDENRRLSWSNRLKILAVTCFAIAVLMPNAVALFGLSHVVGETQTLVDIQDKVSYIDYRVNALTKYTWLFRANLDNWKFLLSGAGQCGEMASLSNIIMQSSAMTSRR